MAEVLNGIRVLDLGRFIAAPYCGMLLGDMGADVIKIEKPGDGDDGRRLGPFFNDISMYANCFNRNKRGITINFRSSRGKELLKDLIIKSDVLIENFRPGTMAKMGFDYKAVSELNPRMIMASISGFGQTGANSTMAAMDGIASAMSGLMVANDRVGIGPHGVGIPVCDHVSGIYTALAIMFALFDRERTGKGQYIDTAMVDCIFSMMESRVPDFGINQVDIGNRSSDADPLACPSNTYQTQDGSICLHAGADPNYVKFCVITEDPVLMSEEYQKIENRMRDYSIVDERTKEWFSRKTTDEAAFLLRNAGVPFGVARNMKRIFADPNSYFRNMIVKVDIPGIGEAPFAGNPIKLETQPIGQQTRAPFLGEHNREVLSSLLGKEEAEITDLEKAGDI